MYPKNETDASLIYLERLSSLIEDRFCLIGGWAVYQTVNRIYKMQKYRDYLGSRDIDIGLPDIDSFIDAQHIITTTLGFETVSFRFMKYLDYDTHREIPSYQAKRIPTHMLISMYIDVMLPKIDDAGIECLGFEPPTEPLLSQVFQDSNGLRKIDLYSKTIFIPSPHLLLAMKINSVGDRTKDHKRIKDICDIAALCLFSGESINELIRSSVRLARMDRKEKFLARLSKEDMTEAGTLIDVNDREMERLFDQFKSMM